MTKITGIKSAVKIARLIQQDIWQELHLTASGGKPYNKFLAKMAVTIKTTWFDSDSPRSSLQDSQTNGHC